MKPASSLAAALCLASLLLGGCGVVHVNRPQLGTSLSKCVEGFATSEIQAVLPDVSAALQGRTADWQNQLDGVITRGGAAAVCALVALLQSLESGTGGASGAAPVVLTPPENGGLPPAVLLLRGYSYLDARR